MYHKQFVENFSIFQFDKIYPIKEITFNQPIEEIGWALNPNDYYHQNLNIGGHTVTFTHIHLKYVKVKGDISIQEIVYEVGFIVEEAMEVNQIFRRTSGWTGADGVYQHQIGQKIYWYFSDTFVGKVDQKTYLREEGFQMVNNTLGISPSKNPFDITFLVNNNNGVDSYFKPEKDGFYWLQDGIYLENYFYLTVIHVVNGDPFEVIGVDTLKIPYENNALQVNFYERVPSNFYIKDQDKLYTFGAAILDHRHESGYIYVFGYDNAKKRSGIVLRLKDHLLHSIPEYLTEYGWSNEPKNLKSIANDIACEYKVIYDNKQFMISYTEESIGKKIMVGTTIKIEDGFRNVTCIYECPEHGLRNSIITYNAKFQVFSNSEDYYISYHVNTSNNEDHKDATIYYPRWIKLKRRSGL